MPTDGPRIGIPLCLDDRGRWRAGRRYQYLDSAYAEAVVEAGGVALYLPLRDDPELLLRQIDGLLLPGGDDLPPADPLPEGVELDLVPARQLRFDRALLSGALDRGLPILAICYGMQLLALEQGGRLHYHLPTDLPEAKPHRLPEPDGCHALSVEPGSRLAALLGPGDLRVNSRHHQAVAEPGPLLRVSARADDEVVEAIEGAEDPFRLGVQWHPENLDADHRARLFRPFVDACTGT
jgi:putative glutamine amidotransferase